MAHPNLGFDFCKGYSARFTDKLNGRVMRLLVTPLIRSLQSIIGLHDFLVYLDTFRYPLSGEMSLDHDIIRRARIPSDWGIEVGILAEVFRVSSPKSICQVDIAEGLRPQAPGTLIARCLKGAQQDGCGYREKRFSDLGGTWR